MRTRIAYCVTTGEIIEACTSKNNFNRMVARMKRDDRECYGVRAHWVFRYPW